jgi:hypothetical protein
LMLVGDLLAYIDIYSVLFLLGVLSRIATIMFIVRRARARGAGLASSLLKRVQDLRHRREVRTRNRKRLTGFARDDDDEGAIGFGWAWQAA